MEAEKLRLNLVNILLTVYFKTRTQKLTHKLVFVVFHIELMYICTYTHKTTEQKSKRPTAATDGQYVGYLFSYSYLFSNLVLYTFTKEPIYCLAHTYAMHEDIA